MGQSDGAGGIQVIARAASIFRVLEAEQRGMMLAEIARATGLPRTTVHRMVGALEAERLLVVIEGLVHLGPALPRLAGAGHADIVALAHPQLESLTQRTGETVKLSVLRGSFALLVEQIASEQVLRVVSLVGETVPLVSTGQGHMLLAGLENEDIARRLDQPWAMTTAATRKDLAEVMSAVETARAQGWALETGEHLGGVCNLAVALNLPLPESYALSIALPLARLPDDPQPLLRALKLCANSIETSF